MKKTLTALFTLFSLLPAGTALAQTTDLQTYSETFHVGEVIEVLETGNSGNEENLAPYQILEVQLLEEEALAEPLELTTSNPFTQNEDGQFDVGDKVVVVKTIWNNETHYALMEPYRLPQLGLLAVLFVILIIAVSGRKGIGSLIGLTATIFITVLGILPAIVAGHNPLLVTLIGATAILFSSLYLAHGFNKKTTLALVSTVLTLILAIVFSVLSVDFAQLFGGGSEEAASLFFGVLNGLNLKGLLLAAMLIGTLGVLDDVTTAQTATIAELHAAKPGMSSRELFRRGFSVGKEHIASLINTLVIAYMGAAFPVLLMITTSGSPLWVMLNNEYLAEEIVRTLVGSSTLLLAVPISTFLAAKFYASRRA